MLQSLHDALVHGKEKPRTNCWVGTGGEKGYQWGRGGGEGWGERSGEEGVKGKGEWMERKAVGGGGEEE